jgi:hypothetical protein
MPELRDGHTDEPILVLTDDCRVVDPAALAGAAVQRLTRELGDPRRTAARRATSRKGRAAAAPDPREMTALIQQMVHRHCANWADEPLPSLSLQTPREDIATPAGPERVKGLLRTYESGEAAMGRRRACVQTRPVDDRAGAAGSGGEAASRIFDPLAQVQELPVIGIGRPSVGIGT